jgi:hypothetical protein
LLQGKAANHATGEQLIKHATPQRIGREHLMNAEPPRSNCSSRRVKVRLGLFG